MSEGQPFRRFADPTDTDTIRLPGPCTCPGTPHEFETATIRRQLGGGERESIAVAGWGRSAGPYFDYEAAVTELIRVGTVAWTLQGADGKPLDITFEQCHLLDQASRKVLSDAINAAHSDQIDAEQALLPNASSARSRDSSRASASPTRKTRSRR